MVTETGIQKEELTHAIVDRVLNLRCNDIGSPQYGSFDRDFWLYRTIRGFQSAPFQHVMAGFAYLSQSATYAATYDCGEIAHSALTQWITQRNINGSANEWYRNEQSYCATAMGLHAATETALILNPNRGLHSLTHQIEALMPSARWLSGRHNPLAANQSVASAAGRWNLATLLSDRSSQIAAEVSIKRVVDQFDQVGYLSEYGGIDIGYTLLSLDLLVSSHSAGCEQVSPLAARICDGLQNLVSKGGDFPFALGSRGTHHPFYAGVHYFSRFVPEAHELLDRLNDRHATQQLEIISGYDDRYLLTFGFAALARLLVVEANQEPKFQMQPASTLTQHEPLLERVDLVDGTLFCNRNLGSALQFLADSHESYVHLGYSLMIKNTRWCSLSGSSGVSGEVSHQFVKHSSSMPLMRFQLAFAVLETLCRIPWIASRVSWWARVKLGRSTNTRSTTLRRTIRHTETTVVIEDEIRARDLPESSVIESLHVFPFHSPSRHEGVPMNQSDEFSARAWPIAPSGSTTIRWELELLSSQKNIRVSEL